MKAVSSRSWGCIVLSQEEIWQLPVLALYSLYSIYITIIIVIYYLWWKSCIYIRHFAFHEIRFGPMSYFMSPASTVSMKGKIWDRPFLHETIQCRQSWTCHNIPCIINRLVYPKGSFESLENAGCLLGENNCLKNWMDNRFGLSIGGWLDKSLRPRNFHLLQLLESCTHFYS
jgi:hypothetical protein